jgi:uncharacterized protein YifE (UPF0438 family)|tara:strand:- start:7098 stop:10940 length:3843 start_codon:yes stop_codon:yes gene_type:complete
MEYRLSEVPGVSTSVGAALGSSLRESGESFVAGIRTAGEAAGTLIDIGLTERAMTQQEGETSLVDLDFQSKYAGLNVEERSQLAQTATAELAGGTLKALTFGGFAHIIAGFDFINAVDEKNKSKLTPFLSAMNTYIEFLGSAGRTPLNREEYDELTQTTVGRWAAKVNDLTIGKLLGGDTIEEIRAEDSVIGLATSKLGFEIDDFFLKTVTEDILNEVLPTLAIVAGFKAAELPIKLDKAKVRERFRDRTSGSDTTRKLTERKRMDAQAEFRDTDLTMEVISKLDEASKKGDRKAFDDIAHENPAIYEKYVTLRKKSEGISQDFKIFLEKIEKGEVPSYAERRSFTAKISEAFTGGSKFKVLNDLTRMIKNSSTKAEYFPEVMRELTTTAMAHPKFMSEMGLGKFTQLKGKAPKTFEEPGKFAQLKGAEVPKRPTAEAAEFKAKELDVKREGLLKEREALIEKKTPESQKRLVEIDKEIAGLKRREIATGVELAEPTSKAVAKVKEGKDLTKQEFDNVNNQRAVVEEMKRQEIKEFEDFIKEEAVKETEIPEKLRKKYIDDPRPAFHMLDKLWSPLNVLVEKVFDKKTGDKAIEIAKSWALKEQKVTETYSEMWNELGIMLEFSRKDYMFSQAKLLEQSGKIFKALDTGKIDALPKELKPMANKLKSKFSEFRKDIVSHEKSMINYREGLSKKAERRIKEINEALLTMEESAASANVLRSQRNSWEKYIEDADFANFKSRDVIERLDKGIENYVPHLVDPIYIDFVKEHFPELYDQMQAGALRMDNRFLKERKDFPFIMEDAVSAAHFYERTISKKLIYEKTAEDIRFNTFENGYHDLTLKGKFTNDYIDQVINEKRRGREAYLPLAEKAVGTIYGAFDSLKRNLNSDMKLLSKILERKIEIPDDAVNFIKENALKPEEIKIETVGNKNILTVNTIKADYLFFDRFITGLKKTGYAGTIGLSARTSTLNLATQPMLSLAYSGLGPIEGFKIMMEGYQKAFKAWGTGDVGKKMRQEMRDTGMSLSSDRLASPERGATTKTRGVFHKALDATLVNMTYTEYIARYVAGYVGQKAFEAGKISKAEYGKSVTINGQKLSKSWADTFNFQYTPEHMSMLAGSPIGRVVFFLNTFAVKNAELHVRLLKKAEFRDWLKKSEEIVNNPKLDTTKKLENIIREYGKNKERIGLGKEAAYGLGLAMVMGQIFDIDWNEFMFQVSDMSISNPMTNLLFGAGGWNQDLIDKMKPFVPLRSGVRSIDKTLGTDILSDYRDYGNVPQIEDILNQ